MNNLAAFYEFLDRHKIKLLITRQHETGTFMAYLDAHAKGESLFGPSTESRGATPDEAAANLAAKLNGVELVKDAERPVRAEKVDVGAYTSASGPEVAHG